MVMSQGYTNYRPSHRRTLTAIQTSKILAVGPYRNKGDRAVERDDLSQVLITSNIEEPEAVVLLAGSAGSR